LDFKDANLVRGKKCIFEKIEVMETLLLQSYSKEEIKLLATLANKMGLKAKVIKNDFFEDIALADAMQKKNRGIC